MHDNTMSGSVPVCFPHTLRSLAEDPAFVSFPVAIVFVPYLQKWTLARSRDCTREPVLGEQLWWAHTILWHRCMRAHKLKLRLHVSGTIARASCFRHSSKSFSAALASEPLRMKDAS